MILKRRIALALCLVLLCLSLISCSNEGGEGATLTVIAPPEAISADKQNDYTQTTVRETVEGYFQSFASLGDFSQSDFETTGSGNSLKIVKYNGTATKVRIPDTVTAIEDGAFAGNKTIEYLYIPDSVTMIGYGILNDCTALKALRTPQMARYSNETQYLGYLFCPAGHATLQKDRPQIDNPLHVPVELKYLELGRMTELPDYALFDCNDLESISLPDCMKSVGAYAMFLCERLLAVNVDELTSIGTFALGNCRSLTRLDFGEEMTSFGFGVLEGCRELRRMILPFVGGTATENTYLGYLFGAEVPDFSGSFYPKYLVEITLLPTCQTLGENAFFSCETLTRVTLPDTLSAIGVRAFQECVRLASIELPRTLKTIGENAFINCHSLKVLTFAEDAELISIGINAFYYCISLESVVLPASLATLPASCFAGCTSLKQIDLGGVTSVGKNAFHNCVLLRTVTASAAVSFAEGNEAAKKLLPQ